MSLDYLEEIYETIGDPMIVGITFFLFIAFICWLLIRSFSNRHSEFIRYYLSKNNIEIEYYYVQKESSETILSPKFSKLFSTRTKFSSLDSLKKIVDKDKIDKLQDLISLGMRYIKEQNFNNKINKQQVILEFIKDQKEHKFIEAQVETITEVENCPVGVVVWFRDVTLNMIHIKELEAELNRLKIDNKFYSDILDNISVPIWVRDNTNKISYYNNEYREIVNLNNDYESIPELVKSSIAIANKARVLQVYQEDKYIIARNERKLFSICENVFRGDSLVGVAFDQSEKEKIKAELKEYYVVQNNFLESSSSAVAIYMADRKIKYFNQAFINLWGLDEKWLFTNPTYGEVLEELRHKRKLPEQADFSAFKKEHLKLFTKLPETYNEFMYLPDGKVLRMIVIPFAAGGLLFAFEDMTSRLVLERSFNSLNAVQKAMLNHLNEAIAVFGQDGRLKVYNPAYLKLLDMEFEYADKSPHIADIIESKKHLFQVKDSNWISVKNDLISVLYEREYQRTTLKMNNGAVIYRTVVPLPDGATLITYVNNSNLVKCQALLSEKSVILNDFFLHQHQLIINIAKQINFISSRSQNTNLSEQIEEQTKEMLNISKINLESVNSNLSIINIEKLINKAIKNVKNSIITKEASLKLGDSYYNSIIGNKSRISMILDKILEYITDISTKEAKLDVEVTNDVHNLILTFIVSNNKVRKNILEQKFLLIQALLETYNEKLLVSTNQDGFNLILNISQFQLNKTLEKNEY
ncbi:MAG: PAS-domain containing protein [Rickettsiales bacterium]|jgi:PAS domain-containing protein|nr:PAS-domain containing protein [Rickettsiales bacterium]